MKYRKKPVVIEAMQYKGVESIPEAEAFVGDAFKIGSCAFDGKKYTMAVVSIETLEGDMYVSNGDYIIKGVQGEFYPCKPDIFEATYDVVDEQATQADIEGHGSDMWPEKDNGNTSTVTGA